VDGHPEIEMALVELYRTTGERRHLDTAAAFLDRRGRGLLGADRFGSAYWQDHAPVREAPSVAGHAVRQLYLDAGAVDVAVETDDAALLDAVRRRWHDMVASRTYLTGGVGSRHRDESFGDPFELPPDQAYTETCAAIASVMLAWRLLLATGDPAAADLIERTLLNGVLSGLGGDGTSFFYVNPLQRRTDRVAADPHTGERQVWYPCACCPPNLMRTLSSWEQLLATRDRDGGGLHLHQYADATIRVDVGGGEVRLVSTTAYPWDGRVTIEIAAAPDRPWTLALRRPAWAAGARVSWPGSSDGHADEADAGRFARTATWAAGDKVVLELPMDARIVEPDPRIDAVRGCAAIERGPIVYAIESADLPAGVAVEDLRLDPAAATGTEDRSELGVGVVGVTAAGIRQALPEQPWPYEPSGVDSEVRSERAASASDPIPIRAIPYHAWANRRPGAMRVWIPRSDAGE
jgi:hypothetical protein